MDRFAFVDNVGVKIVAWLFGDTAVSKNVKILSIAYRTWQVFASAHAVKMDCIARFCNPLSGLPALMASKAGLISMFVTFSGCIVVHPYLRIFPCAGSSCKLAVRLSQSSPEPVREFPAHAIDSVADHRAAIKAGTLVNATTNNSLLVNWCFQIECCRPTSIRPWPR